jgi:selenocysteine-specific elongation factor
MRVIGTAGHVDHGKSSLIEALTGTHPDRLKEEQDRQMTIDLGFGWLTLPDGQEVGIVDVPGHIDFIENMLAGIAGIDAGLLVVAADEGVMPQTREHLAILDLLRVRGGLIALTKTDLITDQDWLEAVEADTRAAVRGTVFQDAPILRVSARTRLGLDDLVHRIGEIVKAQGERPDLGRPRLSVDRVFTMSGFGTVVTGTLSDGCLNVGDEVEFQPSGVAGRIRGLQTHRKKVDRALPGSRTAANVAGISAEVIGRGEVMVHAGEYWPTQRVDARMRLLANASAPLLHHREVKVFIGASQATASIRLLGMEELKPGEEGWIQLELHRPLVCVRGDAFVLRRPSPGETLGGGLIVDAQPRGRHKRFDAAVLASLAMLSQGTPEDVLFEAALALGPAPIKDIVLRSGLATGPAESALQVLKNDGRLMFLEGNSASLGSDDLAMARPQWAALWEKARLMLGAYHQRFPLRAGIPREEFKSRLNVPPRLFGGLVHKLVLEGALKESANYIAESQHEIRFNAAQQARVDSLMQRFAQSPYSPPSLVECQSAVGEEPMNALIMLGRLMPVSSDVVFRKEDYDSMVAQVRKTLGAKGQITLAEVRDLFNTSRKYAQALLEHLDAEGLTRRSGDFRVLAG